MRLWHKDLISVLPQKQLIAQWRELCCIGKNLATKGTPNHLLVNKVMDYQATHFIEYCNIVLKEMHERGYNVNEQSYLNLVNNIQIAMNKNTFGVMFCNSLYEHWMDDRYLRQCYYNLEEKHDCGGIPDYEWMFVVKKYNSLNNNRSHEYDTKINKDLGILGGV